MLLLFYWRIYREDGTSKFSTFVWQINVKTSFGLRSKVNWFGFKFYINLTNETNTYILHKLYTKLV